MKTRQQNKSNDLAKVPDKPLSRAINKVKKKAIPKSKQAPKILAPSIFNVAKTLPHNLEGVKLIKQSTKSTSKTPSQQTPAAAERSKKIRKQYKLTPGISPYPNHHAPTAEACEEVYRLLTEQHGLHMRPEKLVASATIAGCGEVPDILDALLRTLLSQNTTFSNADRALKGLIAAFPDPLVTSPNYDLVHKSSLEAVVKSISAGGGQNVKGKQIKAILDQVYKENLARSNALLLEKETGKLADIIGAKHETQEEKEEELAIAEESLLSLDHLRNLTDDEVMDEMLHFPGIGVKTASCVMLFCLQRASFAVDTHVHRHSKWLGWIPPTANENQAFSHLDVHVPDHLKYGLHQLFIKHGQECLRCNAKSTAGTPGWDDCVCPIEHLVTRVKNSATKGPKPKEAIKKATIERVTKKGGKRVTKLDEDSENEVMEDDIEMSDEYTG